VNRILKPLTLPLPGHWRRSQSCNWAHGPQAPGRTSRSRIAAFGRRVALVPARRFSHCATACDSFPGPAAASNGPVEIRDAATGALVASFSPKGTVKAVAVSAQVVAVLVQRGPSKQIERYDAETGAPVDTTTVPSTTANTLAIAGPAIVYQTHREIWLYDARGGKKTRLARAGATPIGLSIEDRRVAWAENVSTDVRESRRSRCLGECRVCSASCSTDHTTSC
jgi:hypothetical protein